MLRKLSEIPNSDSWKTVNPVEEGWSGDEKFYIETADGDKQLLRLSKIARYERRKRDYEMHRSLLGTELPVSKPIAQGICNGGKTVYTLLTWIEGEDAEKVIPRLPRERQYVLGFDAGEILRTIHEAPVPETDMVWQAHFGAKIERCIRSYEDCKIQIRNASRIRDYIDANRHLMEDRPIVMHHGDYHIGNMVVKEDGELGVIDFDRMSFGDPWEEFNRIPWCAHSSSHFATGRIDGYFGGEAPPEEFFKLLALYIGTYQFGGMAWAAQQGDKEVQTLLEQSEELLRDYDSYSTHFPKWYLKGYSA